jgi:hemerythrin
MKTIEWTEELSVNVKEIDDQHKHFVGLIDDLYSAIMSNKADNLLNGVIDDLVKYAGIHFDTEEKYFDKFQYEHGDEHKVAHSALTARVLEFSNDKSENRTALAMKLLDFLENWLVEHLEIHDKKYTKCFNEHGLY